ncbi:thiamine phosphate synthase [Pseudemcibacter sp.]|jgi:thiamine-phosphate pyrophosphorylase|uniref:thiamine phosphate synthase n=1 Tax=Pseudemcibacter sp. TaxID=2943293 RepID=UPI00230D302C|nr:thiamine phosphate synthase [Kordiimonadaceae bacterium]MDA7568489.1 thiamine phosphate synthase [Emcibacteraceae bacterium]MDA9179902.1 thiamine phosphate synthase [Emcibacteraceae bacterium]MDA9553115.1 thiamine phosphate synthase [Emcibacteraceae bacterium]
MTGNLTEIALELNRESRFDNMPRVIFITDNGAQPYPEDVIERLPKNSMVILRDYDLETRANLGKALRYMCKTKGIKFFVAGDIKLALMLDADGIHLPEFMLSEAEKIKQDYPSMLISVAAHKEETIVEAERLNLFASLLSPIYPTKSHPETFEDIGKTIGIKRLNEVCEKYKIPVYALGGINKETAQELIYSNIAGIAGIRGFKD